MAKDKITEAYLPISFDEWDLFFHALTYQALQAFGYGYNPIWGIDYESDFLEHIYIQGEGLPLLRIKILYVKNNGENNVVTYQLERLVGKRWFKHPLPFFQKKF